MSGVVWKTVKINGNPAHFVDFNDQRLYVYEKPTTIEGWVNSEKVGNFATVKIAKEAAEVRAGVPQPVVEIEPEPTKPRKQRDAGTYVHGDPTRYAIKAPPPKPRVKAQDVALERYPIADLSKPPVIEQRPAVEAPAVVVFAEPEPGRCKCGARLGRSGKCPALCTPVETPAPAYKGPAIVGRTHTGRLGAPVWTPPPQRAMRDGADWIG